MGLVSISPTIATCTIYNSQTTFTDIPFPQCHLWCTVPVDHPSTMHASLTDVQPTSVNGVPPVTYSRLHHDLLYSILIMTKTRPGLRLALALEMRKSRPQQEIWYRRLLQLVFKTQAEVSITEHTSNRVRFELTIPIGWTSQAGSPESPNTLSPGSQSHYQFAWR